MSVVTLLGYAYFATTRDTFFIILALVPLLRSLCALMWPFNILFRVYYSPNPSGFSIFSISIQILSMKSKKYHSNLQLVMLPWIWIAVRLCQRPHDWPRGLIDKLFREPASASIAPAS